MEKYFKWGMDTKAPQEKEIHVIPVNVTFDGCIHKKNVQEFKKIENNKNDWVRISQNVLRYNVVVIGMFFVKWNMERRMGRARRK